MKSKSGLLFLLVFLGIVVFSATAKDITCTIKGTIIDRNSKNILLHKATEDARSKHVVIPILNNSFEYIFTVSELEIYNLIFEDEFQTGGGRLIYFIPENGTVHFTLYPMMAGGLIGKNKVVGGKLNQQLQDQRNATTTHYLEEVAPKVEPNSKLIRELDEKGESKKVDSLFAVNEKIIKKHNAWVANFQDSNPTIYSYYIFTSSLFSNRDKGYANDETLKRASLYSKLYPQHPYTKLVRAKLETLKRIQVGGKYIDFSAPTLEGKVVKLSEAIKDEYVLIDFWGSWCGPCIKTSRSMVPVYEEFKDKGFSVIGVAREFKNTDAYKKAIEREKYPWLSLIELNDQNDIWNMYNLTSTGGGTVLVNKSGDIVAINPTAEELRQCLQKELAK